MSSRADLPRFRRLANRLVEKPIQLCPQEGPVAAVRPVGKLAAKISTVPVVILFNLRMRPHQDEPPLAIIETNHSRSTVGYRIRGDDKSCEHFNLLTEMRNEIWLPVIEDIPLRGLVFRCTRRLGKQNLLRVGLLSR